MLGSVVIPAHNEEAVIRRCLEALVDGMEPGELEVVVACNGCSDGTAEIARSFSYAVIVTEVEEASKPAALRAADGLAGSFPRIYLDADIVLPGASARAVLGRLRSGPALAGRPPIRYETSLSSALVRSYYRARVRLPAVMGSLWGAGTYGLSAAGRDRFGPYPNIVAEDLFVDQQFTADEIEVVDCSPVVVSAPRRPKDLLTILRRTYRGNAENRQTGTPAFGSSGTLATLRDVARLARGGPAAALDACTYLSFALVARLLARLAGTSTWERDESSRAA